MELSDEIHRKASAPPDLSTDDGGPASSTKQKSARMTPPGAVEYHVQGSETLESISAKFDTTPSELVKLNRLPLRMVFPGQRIFIPDPELRKLENDKKISVASLPADLTAVRRTTATLHSEKSAPVFPGHIEAVAVESDKVSLAQSAASTQGSMDEVRMDEEVHARFLKINASLVDDKGTTVSGVLLVTPNAVMFDPNVSDPHVIESGSDKFGVMVPMESIYSVAIYSEIIPKQKVRRASHVEAIPLASLVASREEKEKENSVSIPEEDEGISLPAVSERLASPTQENGSEMSSVADVFNAGNDSSNPAKEAVQQPLQLPPDTHVSRSRAQSATRTRSSSKNSGDEQQNDNDSGPPSRKVSMSRLRKISRSIMGRDSRNKSTGDEETTSSGTFSQIQDGILSRAGSIRGSVSPKLKSFVDYSSGLFQSDDAPTDTEKAQRQASEEVSSPLPGESFTSWQLRRGLSREDVLQAASVRRQKLGYKSIVTVEDKPELFRSIEELFPQASQSPITKPLYLCIMVGTPVHRVLQPIHAPVEAYGKKRLKSEYWFIIDRERAEKFYAFMLHWRPEAYGTENKDPAELGFMLFDEPDEEMNVHFERDLRGMAKEWEVITFDEARRRAFFLDREENLPMPDLHGDSSILNEEICRKLVPHVPPRAQGYPWNLIYSTGAHGFSLKSLYRKMQDVDAPTLLLVKDTNDHVFGAMLSCAFKVQEHFYGTGESLLFTFVPEFRVYNWNGLNEYIVRCQLENIVIGSGGGTFGLWLDEDFFHGRTQTCTTFDNDPLCPCLDFTVKALEAWCFF